MKVRLRGKYWDFSFTSEGLDEDQDGECESPSTKHKKIKVRPDLGVDELRIILHELLHGCLWDLDEEAIDETSTDIDRVLRNLGYRRVDL